MVLYFRVNGNQDIEMKTPNRKMEICRRYWNLGEECRERPSLLVGPVGLQVTHTYTTQRWWPEDVRKRSGEEQVVQRQIGGIMSQRSSKSRERVSTLTCLLLCACY